jgi:hypothetical protein
VGEDRVQGLKSTEQGVGYREQGPEGRGVTGRVGGGAPPLNLDGLLGRWVTDRLTPGFEFSMRVHQGFIMGAHGKREKNRGHS